MKIYTYEFAYEIPDELIGVYVKGSGDIPHELLAFDNPLEWAAPIVEFASKIDRIDALPATTLPLHVVRKKLAEEIKKIAKEEIVLIPLTVNTKDTVSNDFFVIHPIKRVTIWDMDASKWDAADIPKWPKDRPMYMHDMVLKQEGIESFKIAYNKNWSSMLIFNEEIANLFIEHSKWLKIFIPQHYSNA